MVYSQRQTDAQWDWCMGRLTRIHSNIKADLDPDFIILSIITSKLTRTYDITPFQGAYDHVSLAKSKILLFCAHCGWPILIFFIVSIILL